MQQIRVEINKHINVYVFKARILKEEVQEIFSYCFQVETETENLKE